MNRDSGKQKTLRKLTKYEIGLFVLFLLTLPLMNPWVRGDGVGYYAFARSILIEHKLDFRRDWLKANTSFRMGRIDAEGHINPDQYTVTGHLDNHFAVGPAILWAPFLIVAHGSVLLCDRFGARIAADGFSLPYLLAMSFGTALCGFLAVVISFVLARRYVPERWAFLAAVGIWFGSSLPVYMYFDPSWCHAQSAFIVALFIWYWLRTRGYRSASQWALLGAIGGLMMDVYYLNALLLLLPLSGLIAGYWTFLRRRDSSLGARLLLGNVVFSATLLLAFVPTLLAKKVIYGSYFQMGYGHLWNFASPAILKVPFSADHGLFSWTPILIASVVGLSLLWRYDHALSMLSIAAFFVFLYTIGCYADWDGLSSFGNRFFISLNPLFVVGLAALFDSLARAWQPRRASVVAGGATAVLVLWNLGMIFQWGMHLIPPRGPISWRAAAYNQVAVVPERAVSAIDMYLTRRSNLMQHIERIDVKQLQAAQERSAQ
jgi:MFS family permease